MPLRALGFVLRAASPGSATWSYEVNPEHFNPNGALHGGVMMALLDSVMGHAVASLIALDGAFNVAAQMNVNFLSPVHAGTVIATAKVRKHGKRLAIVEAEATDANGAVLALATATHAILRKR
jgi:uncharacterized protein (TIGR00369 family)